MRHSRLQLGMFCIWFACSAVSLLGADLATARDFIAEPPTLISLGFEWHIDGDDNRNATVAVSYRKKGESSWREGLPLLRIGNERINENALQYVVPNGFAGSVFDLDPGTEYELFRFEVDLEVLSLLQKVWYVGPVLVRLFVQFHTDLSDWESISLFDHSPYRV